jgi:biotin synthase
VLLNRSRRHWKFIEVEKAEILNWLREHDKSRLKELWLKADGVREENVGRAVHLRGLIEISNHCVRRCTYCGLNAGNTNLQRYRMTESEIMECAFRAVQFGYGTVVMQAGEDYGIKTDWLADIIRRIKDSTPLAVTLGMGERPAADLRAWRQAGADRYLLRFETSDNELYHKIHPPRVGQSYNRLDLLSVLGELGYEVGSGVLIGVPGQSIRSLAEDIDLFRRLDLDMIGVGPYISHPDTPLSKANSTPQPSTNMVPNNELTAYKVIALTRLLCPQANIPATTALATINRSEGAALGLTRGANVIMPNLTPPAYRELYEIYPEKGHTDTTSVQSRKNLIDMLESIGRTAGKGPGPRVR